MASIKIYYDVSDNTLETIQDNGITLNQGQTDSVDIEFYFGDYTSGSFVNDLSIEDTSTLSCLLNIERPDGTSSNNIITTAITNDVNNLHYKFTISEWVTQIDGTLTITAKLYNQSQSITTQFGPATLEIIESATVGDGTITDTQYNAIIDALDEKSDKGHLHDSRYYTEDEVDDFLDLKEDFFTKNNAFNKNFGTSAGTVSEGNHIHDDRYFTETEIVDGTPQFQELNLKDTLGGSEVARIYFEDGDETDNGADTVKIDLPNGSTLEVGKEEFNDVRNENGQTILNGEVVAITSVVGQQMAGVHADPTDATGFKQYKTFGVATRDIALNAVGDVVTRGVVRDIPLANFDATHPPTGANQFLWVTSNGKLSTQPPAKPAIQHLMAVTLKLSGNHLDIFVYGRLFQKLSDSSDVVITSVADNDILVYDGATGTWVNQSDIDLNGGLVKLDGDDNVLVLDSGQSYTPAGETEITNIGILLTANDENIVIDPQGSNKATIIGNLNTTGDLNLGGSLYINGETVSVEYDRLEVREDTITLRSDATGALGSGDFAGIIAKNADGANDSGLLFNGNGIARVGDITVTDGEITDTSNTQALATREDSPINGGFAIWNASTNRFDTTEDVVAKSGDTMTGDLKVIAKLGVNEANPSAQLEVRPSVSNIVPIVVNGLTGQSANLQEWKISGDTKTVIDESGNVGIGTTSPEYLLHLKKSSNPGVFFENTSNSNKHLVYERNGTTGTEFSIYDLVAGADRFGIDGVGNVGIGTTTPTVPLEVNGIIKGSALHTGGDGDLSTALGVYALANDDGSTNINTAVGNRALRDNTSGNNNTANGASALRSNTTGSNNTATGSDSLRFNTTGTNNTANGSQAGRYIADGSTGNTTGDYNTFIGADTKALADNDQNETVIGYNAIGNGSNTVTIGNDDVTDTHLKGDVQTSGTVTGSNITSTTLTLGSFTLEYNEATNSLNFNFSE